MVGHDAEHRVPHVVAANRVNVEAVEERCSRRHSRFLVAFGSNASVLETRGQRLAHVVAQRAQHHDDRAWLVESSKSRPRLVNDHQRVDPDVAFRVPFRLLLRAA